MNAWPKSRGCVANKVGREPCHPLREHLPCKHIHAANCEQERDVVREVSCCGAAPAREPTCQCAPKGPVGHEIGRPMMHQGLSSAFQVGEVPLRAQVRAKSILSHPPIVAIIPAAPVVVGQRKPNAQAQQEGQRCQSKAGALVDHTGERGSHGNATHRLPVPRHTIPTGFADTKLYREVYQASPCRAVELPAIPVEPECQPRPAGEPGEATLAFAGADDGIGRASGLTSGRGPLPPISSTNSSPVKRSPSQQDLHPLGKTTSMLYSGWRS